MFSNCLSKSRDFAYGRFDPYLPRIAEKIKHNKHTCFPNPPLRPSQSNDVFGVERWPTANNEQKLMHMSLFHRLEPVFFRSRPNRFSIHLLDLVPPKFDVIDIWEEQ